MNPHTAAAIAAALMTSACASSIQSKHYDASALNAVGEGVSYYLPKRMVRLVVERKEAAVDRTKLAGAVQSAKTAEAEAEKISIEKAAALDKAKREHQAAKDAGLSEEALKIFAAAETAADLANKVAAKIHARMLQETKEATARLNAPALTSGAGEKIYEETASFTLLDPVPDQDKRFVAKLHHHWSRSDDWDLNVSASGLLTSATSNPDGQADEIVVEVAKTVLALVNPGGFLSLPTIGSASIIQSLNNDGPGKSLRTGQTCPGDPAYRFELEFDPAQETKDDVNAKLRKLCSLYRVDFVGSQASVVACPKKGASGDSPKEKSEEESTDLKDLCVAKRGLAYRRNRPVVFTIEKFIHEPATISGGALPADFLPHKSTTFLIPNGAPIEVLPFKPSPISAQKMTANFENGMLTKADFEKPGEGLTVAQMPANVIIGAFGLVGELLTLRIENTGKQTQSITNQTGAITELQKLLQAQQDLEKFKMELLNGGGDKQ